MLLGFLGYLLSHPSTSLVRAALNESILLHISGKKSWFGDLKLTIDKLCPSYNLPDSSILLGAAESSILGDYKDVIKECSHDWIQSELVRVSKCSYLLQLCKETQNKGHTKYLVTCLRKYLNDIQNSQYCKAVTWVLAGDHSLAVVWLSWTDNHRRQVPYDECLCCFCRQEVETPEHALLVCQHTPLVELRVPFLDAFIISQPHAKKHQLSLNQAEYLSYLASCQRTFPLFAKWVFDKSPLYVPLQYLRQGETHTWLLTTYLFVIVFSYIYILYNSYCWPPHMATIYSSGDRESWPAVSLLLLWGGGSGDLMLVLHQAAPQTLAFRSWTMPCNKLPSFLPYEILTVTAT